MKQKKEVVAANTSDTVVWGTPTIVEVAAANENFQTLEWQQSTGSRTGWDT